MNRQAYEFLNSVRVLQWRWLRLEARHDELISCLQPAAIRYDKDKVQTSPDDNMSKIIAEVMELEEEMDIIQKRRVQRIKEIIKVLNSIPSDEQRTALTMRFIGRKSVEVIADKMGYAIPTIYKFMNQGAEWIINNKQE